MRHTLYIFWIGQPVGWIVVAVARMVRRPRPRESPPSRTRFRGSIACAAAVVGVGARDAGFRRQDRGQRHPRGANMGPDHVRHAPRTRDPLCAAAVLDRHVRPRLVSRVERGRCLRRNGADGAVASVVPDVALARVQPLRRGPPSSGREGQARRALQERHALGPRDDAAGAPRPRDPPRNHHACLRRRIRRRSFGAADPHRRPVRSRDGRHGRLHPDHGGPNRLGSRGLRRLVRRWPSGSR